METILTHGPSKNRTSKTSSSKTHQAHIDAYSPRQSPSDVPRSIMIYDHREFHFNYSVNEVGLTKVKGEGFEFEYSKETGRLYALKVEQGGKLSIVKNKISEIINDNSSDRIKNNLKMAIKIISELTTEPIKGER